MSSLLNDFLDAKGRISMELLLTSNLTPSSLLIKVSSFAYLILNLSYQALSIIPQ